METGTGAGSTASGSLLGIDWDADDNDADGSSVHGTDRTLKFASDTETTSPTDLTSDCAAVT